MNDGKGLFISLRNRVLFIQHGLAWVSMAALQREAYKLLTHRNAAGDKALKQIV